MSNEEYTYFSPFRFNEADRNGNIYVRPERKVLDNPVYREIDKMKVRLEAIRPTPSVCIKLDDEQMSLASVFMDKKYIRKKDQEVSDRIDTMQSFFSNVQEQMILSCLKDSDVDEALEEIDKAGAFDGTINYLQQPADKVHYTTYTWKEGATWDWGEGNDLDVSPSKDDMPEMPN